MGRKEDEEKSEVSKDTNGSIEELTKKCKPLNVQLDRLELPKNGVVIIKDDESNKLKNVSLNSNPGECSDFVVHCVDKEKSDENTNDAAETIKKIKEFIALGRSEENKKEQDSSDRKVGYSKSKIATKRKLQHEKDTKTPKKYLKTSESLSADKALERTLQGQESLSSSVDSVYNDLVGDVDKKNKIDVDELNIDETCRNNELSTPSRVSKRIQSKSVKFSVKKLLRGDDVNVLKRIIPGYQANISSSKERPLDRKSKTDVKIKKVSSSVKPTDPTSPVLESSPERELISPTPATTNEEIAPNDSTEESEPSTDIVTKNSVGALIENKEKVVLSEKIGKFAIGNGKITVEFKGPQQKKVVRIAVPPSQSPLPNTSLGPDIIIKRVKPVKKTVVVQDNPSSGVVGLVEKEVLVEQTSSNVPSAPTDKMLKVNLERITPPKLKENFVKMHKNILRRGKADKRKSKEVSSHSDAGQTDVNVTSESSVDGRTLNKISKEPNKELTANLSSKGELRNQDQMQSLDNPPESIGISDRLGADELKKLSPLDKIRGRKTAKVMPLTHVKSKSETIPKKPLSKLKKPVEAVPMKPANLELILPEKQTYDTLFDRYFSTKERYVEHHDSLDSDSGEEGNDEIYAHFVNLKKLSGVVKYGERNEESLTMYDLMQDITLELPTWNIHVSSDGRAFCLAQVDIVNNIPVMKKVIEVDLDYNVKVFVGGSLAPEYEGNYSGYEEIRQLIYNVDKM